MTELATSTQPAFVAPDGGSVWWAGAWIRLDPRALSSDGRWLLLGGEWRPIFMARADGQFVPVAPMPPQPPGPTGVARQSHASKPGRTPLQLAALVVSGALVVAAIAVAVVWSMSSSSKPSSDAGSTPAVSTGNSPDSGSSAGNSAGSGSTNFYDAAERADLRQVAEDVESANVDSMDYTRVIFGSGRAQPGVSVTGAQQPVGADQATLSPGDTITLVTVKSTSYCLKATSTHVPTIWYYDSANGGLTQTACS